MATLLVEPPPPRRVATAARKGALAAAIVLLAWASPIAARAQGVPSSAPAVPQGSPIPRIIPPNLPSVGPSAPATAPRENAVPNRVETVASVRVIGSTAYSQAVLGKYTSGLTGQVTLARIEAARLAILERYRHDGYLLTAVNARLDAGHRLTFSVVEGRIADVKLAGNIGPAGTQVLRFLNHLKGEQPVSNASLERWLLLAQDVPGVSVHAVLRPSTTSPGSLDLVVEVKRKAFSGLFTADNRNAPFVGPEEGLIVLDANSFTSLGEKTEVALFHTFNNTENFGQASFDAFLGGSGLKMHIYGGAGHTDPSGQLRATGYAGVTEVGGLALTYPVIRARVQTLDVGLYFDVTDATISTGNPPMLASKDAVRALRWGADYVRHDVWLGDARPATDYVMLRMSHGLPILGAARQGDPMAERLGEVPTFTKIATEISRTQTLFSPWSGASVALMGLVAGQYSPDVLPPSETFYLGGSQYTRGFYAGQVSGDTGLAATAELQLNTGFTTTIFGHVTQIATQFYVFYDWGETWESQRIDPNHRLQSEGVGARMAIDANTEFDLEGVIRQTRNPQGVSSTVAPLSANAIYWRVLTRF